WRSWGTRCGWEMRGKSGSRTGGSKKHDKRDARLILRLLLEERFPRIWIPSVEERNLRQLLLHRWHLVRMRARIKNQLQHIALKPGFAEEKQAVDEGGAGAVAEAGAGTLGAASVATNCWKCWSRWAGGSSLWIKQWSKPNRKVVAREIMVCSKDRIDGWWKRRVI
ncbi:MAG: transposase, partial [Candidatus Angelobacter sp.]